MNGHLLRTFLPMICVCNQWKKSFPILYNGCKCQLGGSFRTLDSVSIVLFMRVLITLCLWRQCSMNIGFLRHSSPILKNVHSQLH